MKKMQRILSAFLVMLTLVMLLGVLPETVHAASIKAPTVSISNDADTGKVVLSWGKVSGAAKYEIYRATSKTGTYSRQSSTTSTTYTNTSAEVGIQYYYKVRAVAKDGSYANSKIVSRTCDLPRPVVSLDNSTVGKIKISWDAIDGAVKYKVYRSTDGETWTLLKNTADTKLTNAGLTSGTAYYYKVLAIASVSSANSAYSEAVSITAG